MSAVAAAPVPVATTTTVPASFDVPLTLKVR